MLLRHLSLLLNDSRERINTRNSHSKVKPDQTEAPCHLMNSFSYFSQHLEDEEEEEF